MRSAYRLRASRPSGPYATAAIRSRLHPPGTTRLALRASRAGSGRPLAVAAISTATAADKATELTIPLSAMPSITAGSGEGERLQRPDGVGAVSRSKRPLKRGTDITTNSAPATFAARAGEWKCTGCYTASATVSTPRFNAKNPQNFGALVIHVLRRKHCSAERKRQWGAPPSIAAITAVFRAVTGTVATI